MTTKQEREFIRLIAGADEHQLQLIRGLVTCAGRFGSPFIEEIWKVKDDVNAIKNIIDKWKKSEE